jgi:hypothetical protein
MQSELNVIFNGGNQYEREIQPKSLFDVEILCGIYATVK